MSYDVLAPVFREDSDSFTITFRENPWLSLFAFAIGPLVFAFAESGRHYFYGGIVTLAGIGMVLSTIRYVRFDCATRTLTVERGWGLRKTAYDMNLLDSFRIARVKTIFRHEYRCYFSIRHGDGRREEAEFGPFRKDEAILLAAECLERALGRPVLTA